MLIHFFNFCFAGFVWVTGRDSNPCCQYIIQCVAQNPVWSQLTRGRAETSISPEVCDKDILMQNCNSTKTGLETCFHPNGLKGRRLSRHGNEVVFVFEHIFSELWITARFNQHWFASCRFVRWLRKNSVIAAWWFSFFWIVVSQKFDGGKNMSACCSKVSRETIAHQNEQI